MFMKVLFQTVIILGSVLFLNLPNAMANSGPHCWCTSQWKDYGAIYQFHVFDSNKGKTCENKCIDHIIQDLQSNSAMRCKNAPNPYGSIYYYANIGTDADPGAVGSAGSGNYPVTEAQVPTKNCNMPMVTVNFVAANPLQATRTFSQATNNVSCSNGTFGKDPAQGVVKACRAANNSTILAEENGRFTALAGVTIVYSPKNPPNSASKTVSQGTHMNCDTGTFGDPLPGIVKMCVFNGKSVPEHTNFVAQ